MKQAASKTVLAACFVLISCFSCSLLHAGFLFGLLFSTEDGGDMFFQNIS
jgi:hypothetical protein